MNWDFTQITLFLLLFTEVIQLLVAETNASQYLNTLDNNRCT